MPKVEFHFDFGSPNAYFSHRVIPGIEQRTGAKFDYVPVLLGGVFKATGNRSRRKASPASRTSRNTNGSKPNVSCSATASRATGAIRFSRSTH